MHHSLVSKSFGVRTQASMVERKWKKIFDELTTLQYICNRYKIMFWCEQNKNLSATV